jgi:hypothetical protein
VRERALGRKPRPRSLTRATRLDLNATERTALRKIVAIMQPLSRADRVKALRMLAEKMGPEYLRAFDARVVT